MSAGDIAIGAQAFGAGASAVGSYYDAVTSQINLQTQAYLDNVNARIAELGAESALSQGQQQVGALTMRAGQIKGAQRAGMAANGIDLGTGSAAEVLASTDIMKSIDMDTTLANATRVALGYRAQATNYQNDAIMRNAQAGAINPALSGAASLLGGAGRVASTWYTVYGKG